MDVEGAVGEAAQPDSDPTDLFVGSAREAPGVGAARALAGLKVRLIRVLAGCGAFAEGLSPVRRVATG
jgi:hypothetical protein